eukprot:jgi/Mesvir1/2752/Mv14369-RA.1
MAPGACQVNVMPTGTSLASRPSYASLCAAPVGNSSCRRAVISGGFLTWRHHSACTAGDLDARATPAKLPGRDSQTELCSTRGCAASGEKGPGAVHLPGMSHALQSAPAIMPVASPPDRPIPRSRALSTPRDRMTLGVLASPGNRLASTHNVSASRHHVMLTSSLPVRRLSSDTAGATQPSDEPTRSAAAPRPQGVAGPLPGVTQIRLAQMGEGIAEVELIQWHVVKGANVREFDKLCSVQSDKAAVDITSRYAGTVTALHFSPGDIIKVGQALVDIVLPRNMAASEQPASPPQKAFGSPSGASVPDGASTSAPGGSSPAAAEGGAPSAVEDHRLATPAVRSLLKLYGLSLADVPPSGRDGRVLKEDVLRVVAARPHAATSSPSPSSPPLAASASMTSPSLSAPLVREPAVGAPSAAPCSPSTVPGGGEGAGGRAGGEEAWKGVMMAMSRGRPDQVVELRGYRRAMARSMAATTHIPLFHLGDEICVDELADLRAAFSRDLKNGPGARGDGGADSRRGATASADLDRSACDASDGKSSAMSSRGGPGGNQGGGMGGSNRALDASSLTAGGGLTAAPPRQRLTYVPFLLKALSAALSEHPLLNSTIHVDKGSGGSDGGRREEGHAGSAPPCTHVVLRGRHNIGIAMDTPRGLVVPNIKDCQDRSILQIADELARLQSLAISGALPEDDLTGGTITVSNIGSIGGTYSSPIVHGNEVAIVALGRVMRLPRFNEQGEVVPVSVMKITWGADHRVVDGATLARFCNTWKRYVEKPHRLLVQLT